MFDKTDRPVIKSLAQRPFERDGPDQFVANAERNRAYRPRSMIPDQTIVGPGYLNLPVLVRRHQYSRLLVDRLVHGRFQCPDKIGFFLE